MPMPQCKIELLRTTDAFKFAYLHLDALEYLVNIKTSNVIGYDTLASERLKGYSKAVLKPFKLRGTFPPHCIDRCLPTQVLTAEHGV
jgi:hypothetical protein